MKKMTYLALFLGSAISSLSFANDQLDANCLQLNDQCIYTALQKRDAAQVKKLLSAESLKMLSEQQGLIDTLMQQVPTQDPLSVEMPLNTDSKAQTHHQNERIYFYIYTDYAVRLRVLYASAQPNAKVTGFWIAKSQ